MNQVLKHVRIVSQVPLSVAASALSMTAGQLASIESGYIEPSNAVYEYYGRIEEQSRSNRNKDTATLEPQQRTEFMRWLYTGDASRLKPKRTRGKILMLLHPLLRGILRGALALSASLIELQEFDIGY